MAVQFFSGRVFQIFKTRFLNAFDFDCPEQKVNFVIQNTSIDVTYFMDHTLKDSYSCTFRNYGRRNLKYIFQITRRTLWMTPYEDV